MRLFSATMALLTVMSAAAHAATDVVPCPPATGASQATMTAPTNPTERVMANAAPETESRPEGVAVPQVAVPLKRGAADATALKPGKQQLKPTGQVDDKAARCRATRP